MHRNMFGGILVLLLSAMNSSAQDEGIKEIEQKYKGAHAIGLRHTEHLVITQTSGGLAAESQVLKERLLLTERAPEIYDASYVHHSFFHKLEDLKAVSYIPDWKKGYKEIPLKNIRTTHATDDNVFYDDTKLTTISHPGLTRYSRIELRYRIIHRDIHFLPAFYFQDAMPAVRSVYKITVPKSVDMGFVLKGSGTDRIKATTEETRNTITYIWSAEDMPRYRSYSNAPSLTYEVPHLIPYVKSYSVSSKAAPVTVFGTVADLYRFYFPFIRDVNRKPDPKVGDLVRQLTEGITDSTEKAKRIYAWVQQHIKYVAFEDGMGGFIPREAGLVLMRKFGDCKDMSSLLVDMCRAAGLPAYFTWIGTRNKPYTYEEAPLPIVNDHMIAALKLGGRWIFLDGTDPAVPFGTHPYSLQGKEALIGISAEKYALRKVPEVDAGKNMMVDSTFLRILGDSLTGTATIRYQGYGAWIFSIQMAYKNEKEKASAIRAITARGSNKYMQRSFDYGISENDAKDAWIRSDFRIDDYLQKAGKEKYINLNLQRLYDQSYIDTSARTIPVENKYKSLIRQVVVMEIPEGYRVSYLPADAAYGRKGLWGFRISYKNTGKHIRLTKELEWETLYIRPDQFAENNRISQELSRQYKESIILTEN